MFGGEGGGGGGKGDKGGGLRARNMVSSYECLGTGLRFSLSGFPPGIAQTGYFLDSTKPFEKMDGVFGRG